ncbi:hypothetical protein GCM10025881_39310 [Pseudolysinimonas kribbensis]|uniref:Biotin transporter BioY n=1 Tax=Pseudolysinimonas kribbensis TaxID=433641 RepID=A0ABQ6K8S9_9MICO|nr:biotin transporter BioY [Pseudolysinimonas kribbensis]GMA93198.1 hypothetical protein GCM10025881_00220 [Pseudolysinimonas kribbensis]GMA97107.1 hypothetical protein GCM10025881_39310 [Pseudolysinimonas kribbensis]
MTIAAPVRRPVLADRVVPRSWITSAIFVVGGTGLVALLAQVAIPLWPVPITGQTFAVLFVGAALGPVRGALSMALYLVLGVAGLPIFTGGAHGSLFALASGGTSSGSCSRPDWWAGSPRAAGTAVGTAPSSPSWPAPPSCTCSDCPGST